MSTVIKLKRGTTAPTNTDIVDGEVAIDTSNQKFYVNDSGTIKEIAGGGTLTLNELQNVTETSSAKGQYLNYNGSNWRNEFDFNIGKHIPLLEADGSQTSIQLTNSRDVSTIDNLLDNIITQSYYLPFTKADGSNVTSVELGKIPNTNLSNSTITLSGDSGSNPVDLGDTLTISGDTGITTSVSGDSISIDLDDTAVTPGTYGSSTVVPQITVDQQGRITSLSTAALDSYITASSTNTLTNKTFDANGTGNSISNIEVADLAAGVLDTDLASVASTDTTLASAKAIKSYVDTQVATVPTGDITEVTAGTGLSGGGTSGAVTLNIDSTVATLTGSQTLTNKTLTSPVISTISNTGTLTLPSSTDTLVGRDTTDTLTNKTINSASNTITITESDISDLGSYITASSTDTLTNKSINLTNNTLSGTTAEFNTALSDGSFVTLAGTETLTNKTIDTANNTITIVESDISDLGSYITASSTDTLTNKTINGSQLVDGTVTNTKLTNSSITVTDGTTSTATSLGGTITFSGTANEIEVGESSGTLTFGLPDNVTIGNNLTISGNLTVSGTTTTVNTETINLADNTITLNSNETGTPSQDGGIEIERGTSANKTLIWNETTDKWTVGSETFVAGTFEGNLTGNVTGDVTGNADTATTLETARSIAGQSFDGSADITIASTDLSDTSSITLNSATQTLTNKTINSASNTITITESDISDLGSYITASSTDTLTNKTIDGSNNTISNIGNSSLTNSSITINGSSVALGGSTTISTASTLTLADDTSTTASIDLNSETLTVAGGTNITTSLSGNTLTINGPDLTTFGVTSTSTELNLLDGVTGITLGNANELLVVGSDGSSIDSDSTLAVDTSNNRLGINQSSPEVTLHMTGEGAQTAQIRMEQYNDTSDAPDLRTRRYRGTISSPSAVQSGDYLYRSNHEYYNGTSLVTGGSIAFDNTNNAARTEFKIAVDTDGTGSDVLNGEQFKIDGNDGGAITFNNAYKFPTSDGSANQVLQTDGSGTLSFSSPAAGTFTLSADSGSDDTFTTGNTLTFAGGTGIDTTVSDDQISIAIDSTVTTNAGTQTLTNKTIDSASNTLTLDLGEGTLTGTTAEFNTALQDGSFATLAGTETLTNKTINSSNNTITIDGTEATLSNIGNASLSNSSITISDGSNSTATSLGGTITIQGTANEVEVAESSGTVTVGLPTNPTVGGNLTVTGDLTVNGTTTTISTTNTVASDTLFELGNGTTGTPANDSGIIIERGDSDNAFIGFDESADKFTIGTTTATGASTGNLTITTGTLVANLEATTATLGGSDIISTDNTKTLTNKTIDASSNTLSNIGNSSLTNSTITITGDSGSNAVDLGDTLSISGDTGITTTVSGDSVSVDLDDTAVTSGSYGSTTSIPTFTVDQQGRLTAANEVSVATTLTVADDSSTNANISLLTDTLTVSGTSNEIETSISGSTLTIGLPDNVTVGNNLTVTGNSVLQGDITLGVNSGDSTEDTITVNGRFVSSLEPLNNITYDLGSPNRRWRDLYLSGNTIDIGGAQISGDGTGQILISATGATLPVGSRVGTDTIASADANTGVAVRNVPFFTKEDGLSTAAINFKFSAGSNNTVFQANHTYTLANGTNTSQLALFVF